MNPKYKTNIENLKDPGANGNLAQYFINIDKIIENNVDSINLRNILSVIVRLTENNIEFDECCEKYREIIEKYPINHTDILKLYRILKYFYTATDEVYMAIMEYHTDINILFDLGNSDWYESSEIVWKLYERFYY